MSTSAKQFLLSRWRLRRENATPVVLVVAGESTQPRPSLGVSSLDSPGAGASSDRAFLREMRS